MERSIAPRRFFRAVNSGKHAVSIPPLDGEGRRRKPPGRGDHEEEMGKSPPPGLPPDQVRGPGHPPRKGAGWALVEAIVNPSSGPWRVL